ncbi:hypothetical protein ACHAXR_003589 [Thalassiosira sp. AJA248-18]
MSCPSSRRRSVHFVTLVAIIAFATVSTILLFSKLGSRSSSYDDISFAAPTIDAEWTLSDRMPGLSGAKNATRTKRIPFTRSGGYGPLFSSPREQTTLSDQLSTPSDELSAPSDDDVTGGLHMCTCLTDDDPRNANLPDTPRRLRWLHIPKTGTSFISTLWSYAASTSDRYIDLSINSHFCNNWDNTSYSMYDFCLMRRYPWEIYGAQNMIPSSSSSSASASRPFDKNTPLGLVGGTQHVPLTPSLKDRRFTSSARYHRIKRGLKRWGSEIFDHNMTVVSFFRQPEERIVSAYYDGRHSSGFPSDVYKKMVDASVQKTSKHRCTIDNRLKITNPLDCFANFPGIAGCMSRMLTGETCADGLAQKSGLDNLPDAITLIMEHLDFVGLTEDWNESICQFHRLFTGKLDGLSGKRHWDPPLQGEFTNVHKSNKKKTLGVEHLYGFKDSADTVLYEAAKLKFERMIGGERCYKYMPCDELKAQKQANSADLPFVKMDEEGNVCEPKSCSDLGKQCGEWDDECGKTIICGMCNSGRTGLPSTWRVKCVEGQCIDYCPPWDDKGYWFLSDDSPSPMKKVVGSLLDEQEQKYLSPVNAVIICEIACNVEVPDGFEIFKNTGLCQCGTTSRILSRNLTRQDFTLAHDLNAMCRENKARKEAILLQNDTQPICCPFIHPKQNLTSGWNRLSAMGKSNLEGEYFDHVPMGCGAFLECETVARQKQAEMAVYDMFNSMCYLARNVVDLGDFFTVTKDNQYRYIFDLRP